MQANYLLNLLLRPLTTRRKLHQVDEERAFVPHVGHGHGRFCEQDLVHWCGGLLGLG